MYRLDNKCAGFDETEFEMPTEFHRRNTSILLYSYNNYLKWRVTEILTTLSRSACQVLYKTSTFVEETKKTENYFVIDQ